MTPEFCFVDKIYGEKKRYFDSEFSDRLDKLNCDSKTIKGAVRVKKES